MSKQYIECDCKSEVLAIEYDSEFKEYYLCILTRQFAGQSFWHRFHHIWHCLRYGTPYTDQICLKKSDVVKLYDWVRRHR